MAAASSNVYVDITDVLDRKLEALQSHVSQHQDPPMLDGLIRDWGRDGGPNRRAFPHRHLAEGFQRVATT